RNLTVRRIVNGPVAAMSTAALQSPAPAIVSNSGTSAAPTAHLPTNQRTSCSVALGTCAFADNMPRPAMPYNAITWGMALVSTPDLPATPLHRESDSGVRLTMI